MVSSMSLGGLGGFVSVTHSARSSIFGLRRDAGDRCEFRRCEGAAVDQCRKDIRACWIAQRSAEFRHVQMRAAHKAQYMSEPRPHATVGAVASMRTTSLVGR